jgi:type IX secretion system PorP/SprF family membrane protein
MKSRFFLTVGLIWLVSNVVFGQQTPLFTNYLTNSFGFNPVNITADEAVNARLMYRNQWVQFDGGPQTGLFALYGKLRNKPLAFGGYGVSDRAGTINRSGGALMIGATQALGENSSIGVGFSAGYFQYRLSDTYRAEDMTDANLALALAGKSHPDFAAGLLLRAGNFQWGVSVPQIFEPKLNFSSDVEPMTVLRRHYYNYLSYKLPLSDKVTLEPGALIKYYPNVPLQWEGMARIILSNAVWLGGNYRHQESAAAVVGYQNQNLILSYGYDTSLGFMRSTNAGSHELTLGVRFGAVKDKDKDGILDKEDECPEVAGVKENKGCPADDRDRDGIKDDEDACPDVKGVKENQGCPADDRDRDGVKDAVDECPDEKGEAKLKGCPDKNKDTDGDGVPDNKDQCPNLAGLPTNSGCPFGDSDNDGIRDDIDRCPTIAGAVENLGCPNGDRDQDGILDSVDPCPDEPGLVSNAGCPPGKGPNALNGDRDDDGISDAKDKCPNTPGTVELQGCPEVLQEAVQIRDLAIKNVYFEFDKAEITAASFQYLDKMAAWLLKHPEYKLYMQGHTDSRGEVDYNIELSKNRVYAVRYYLERKGVPSDRVRVEWFGESKPIANNINEDGRSKNRRVEMEFEFD